MSLTPQQKHFFTLYKNILKIHKQVLPFEMRVIGNSFVKDEFRKHKNVDSAYMTQFLAAWDKYYDGLVKSPANQIGKDLSKEEMDLLDDDQKKQLNKLHQETNHLFDKEEKGKPSKDAKLA